MKQHRLFVYKSLNESNINSKYSLEVFPKKYLSSEIQENSALTLKGMKESENQSLFLTDLSTLKKDSTITDDKETLQLPSNFLRNSKTYSKDINSLIIE